MRKSLVQEIKSMTRDLNLQMIVTDDVPQELLDFSTSSGNVRAVFKNLDKELIPLIERCPLVIGCVAWLTSEPILRALAKTQTSIIVQKEDFLRPDIGADPGYSRKLRSLYDELRCDITRDSLPGYVHRLSVCGDPTVQPVRCVGGHNREKKPAFPRAHHKFLVFCSVARSPDMHEIVIPGAVWTGSFNFTQNSMRSFENAVIIEDTKIAQAYAWEYSQVFALSEPLDWESEWVEPEYRIGT
jgi:hypothetical protein